MSRYVKVSAIAQLGNFSDYNYSDYRTDDGSNPELSLQRMISYLGHCLDQVAPDRPDLIALPESFDRFPSHSSAARAAYYEVRGHRIRDFLCTWAREHGSNIAYNYNAPMDDGTRRNQTVFINRQGGFDGFYNKNHLVDYEFLGTNMRFGKDAPVIRTDFGTVGGAICFDLNFDELRHKYMKSRPELLVFCSQYHGADFVQSYWAYTCRSWFLGAVFNNPCTVVNPVGMKVAQSTNYYPYVTHTINLDYAVVHLDQNWDKLTAARRKYGSAFRVTDPGYVGAVMLSSESDAFSAMDVVREFDIKLLDDYFDEAMALRHAPGSIEE